MKNTDIVENKLKKTDPRDPLTIITDKNPRRLIWNNLSIIDLGKCLLVSKYWNNAVKEKHLWVSKFKQYFPLQFSKIIQPIQINKT